MSVETPDLPIEKSRVNVHLFNCDRTYKLESVEKLLSGVKAKAKCEFSISKHYFPLRKMAETCAQLAEYQMDFAIFVVHANESRLSLNEERAGIGYAKIYRALLDATGNRVLIVIGRDEYYEGEEDTQVLSRWAKLKILSQFSPEYLDGRKSFIFSWETKHRLIHEDAILHFLDPQKQGQIFVPEVRSAPEPEQLRIENPEYEETTRKEENFDPQAYSDKIHEDKVQHFLDPQKQGQVFAPEVRSAPEAEQLRTEIDEPGETTRNGMKLQPKTDGNVISELPVEKQNAAAQQKNRETKRNTVSLFTGIKEDSSSQGEQGEKETDEEQEECIIIDDVAERVTETHQSSRRAEENNKVLIAMLGYKVQESSLNAVEHFLEIVGEKLDLPAKPVVINNDSAKELKELFASTELSSSNFVILVVEKAALTSKDKLPFLGLLEEIDKNKDHQSVVIVCKDKDWEAGQNMLVSQCVVEHAKQFGEHVDRDNWVVYSWNEDDENFNTQSHKDDLVKKARNWFETQHLQTAEGNTEVVNRDITESQNVSLGADPEKMKHSDNPSYRDSGGLLRMTVSLDHGEIVDKMQTFPDNWEPPPELLRGLKKLFHDTPFIKMVEIWEEEDGSHSIKKLDTTLDTTKILFVYYAGELLKMVKQKLGSD